MRLLVADAYPCNTCEVKYCRQNCQKFNTWLDTVIEAEPVVHGEWGSPEIVGYDGIHAVYAISCSACGRYTELHYPRFCPNCGAKMDGGKKDDTETA